MDPPHGDLQKYYEPPRIGIYTCRVSVVADPLHGEFIPRDSYLRLYNKYK